MKVGCGAEFSVLLDCKGTLYSFGLPEYGQLGHNTNGEYIERAGAINFATVKQPKAIMTFVEKTKNKVEILPKPEIRDFACGTNHTVRQTNIKVFLVYFIYNFNLMLRWQLMITKKHTLGDLEVMDVWGILNLKMNCNQDSLSTLMFREAALRVLPVDLLSVLQSMNLV